MAQIIARADRITAKSFQKILYSDFDVNFDLNPINTGSLVKLTNDNAVRRAIENLILTNRGERYYHADIGSDIQRSLFEPLDELTTNNLKTAISDTIRQHEPRVSNLAVDITSHPRDNMLEVTIVFAIANIPNQQFKTIITRRIR